MSMTTGARTLFVGRRLDRRLIGAVALAVAAGCGADDRPAGDVVDANAAWVEQVLDTGPYSDSRLLVAADGEQVVVVVASENGTITGYASSDGAPFEAGEPTAGRRMFTMPGGVARTDGGWLLVTSDGPPAGGEGGDHGPGFDLRVYRSSEGLGWSPVATTGLDGPADVNGVVAVGDGVVAVGALRTAGDPSAGGFRPVAWHSPDGERWTAHPLWSESPADHAREPRDPYAGEGYVQGVAVADDTVVAVGRDAGRSAMWRSEDGGRTWDVVAPDGLEALGADPGLGHVAAQGDVVVLSGTARDGGENEPAPRLWRSTDGGHTWQAAGDPPPQSRGEEEASPVFASGGRFFMFTSSFVSAFDQAEVCYADIDLCRQDTAVTLYVSEDGDAWSRVDTSGVGAPPGDEGEGGELDAVAATDSGRVVGARRGFGAIAIWTWPAGSPLPTTAEPEGPAIEVEIPGHDDPLEPGVRSAVPLYIHCGMDWLYAGGDAWRRTDRGPDVETGAGDGVPADWPVAQQTIFGYATLVADDRIEYSIGEASDAEVIATYERAAEEPPGCE